MRRQHRLRPAAAHRRTPRCARLWSRSQSRPTAAAARRCTAAWPIHRAKLLHQIARCRKLCHMGQADHRHLGRHHRVGRNRHLFQRLQKHLPHPGQHPHRQLLGQRQPPRAFVGRNCRILRRLRRDRDDRQPMRDLGQIAQHHDRIRPVGILPAQFVQGARRIARHDRLEQVHHPAPVGKAQHRAHLIRRRFAGTVGNCLIQQAHRVAHRPFRGPRDQRQRVFRDLRAFQPGHLLQMRNHHLRLDPAQIKPLTPGQHRHWHLADLGGRKQKLHVRGRLFQRLEQRIERTRRQHVNLVDDEDLVARRRRPVTHRLDDRVADVLHAGVRRRVHLHHINMPPLGDAHTILAHATRVRRRPATAIRPDTVQPLGNDPRRRRLTRPANSRQHERLRNPVGVKRVLQRAHHRFLPDQIGKGGGSVFAGKNLIGGLVFGAHGNPSLWVRRKGMRARPRRLPDYNDQRIAPVHKVANVRIAASAV